MNKVLVTGLALGYEVDACQVCNFDFTWLLRYPSVLLWTDSILVTSAIWDSISSGKSSESPEMSKSLRLIFDMAKAEGIVRIVNPTEVITPALRDDIFTEVEKDRDLLSKVFPDHVRLGDEEQVPGQVFIDGYEYCSVYLWSVYAGLILARAWDAHCLFSESVFNYCRYKFGLSSFPKEGDPGRIESFRAVFEAYVPNSSILPEYALVDRDLCSMCAKEQTCRDTYLLELEANLKKLFVWRDYDEIQQLKAVVKDIVHRREKSRGMVDPSDILRDFRGREDKLRRRVKLAFPKVKRWANITTMLSIPVAVAGVASEVPLITVAGAGLAGLSQLAKELIDLLSGKYSWIGFVSKETELREV